QQDQGQQRTEPPDAVHRATIPRARKARGHFGDAQPQQQAVEAKQKLERAHRPPGAMEASPYFQIGVPSPGNPSASHISLTFSTTAWSMRISSPPSRFVSGGHLSVASSPIFEPRPLSGLAKSR